MKSGGLLYIVTDVKDLYDWMERHLREHQMFEQLNRKSIDEDPCVQLITKSTEESHKVIRRKGEEWHSVFKRI